MLNPGPWVCASSRTKVILPPYIPWIGQGGGILLHCSMICVIGFAIFDYTGKGWEQITFSLAKLMIIVHIAFTGDDGLGSMKTYTRAGDGVAQSFQRKNRFCHFGIVFFWLEWNCCLLISGKECLFKFGALTFGPMITIPCLDNRKILGLW